MDAERATLTGCEQGELPGELVEFLSRPASYPERTKRVERIDTHISTVFLTGRCAYKLKRPVVFEFLDFRDPAARLAACREELRVNRRLAPDVYLDVVGLARDDRGYHWAEAGETACEWAVKMRRLPDDARLDQLLLRQALRDDDSQRLIDLLVSFYQQLPPLAALSDAYRAELARHVAGNEQELLAQSTGARRRIARRVHDAQRRLLDLWPERWHERVCDGRVVDGHGDLRPEHIYVTAPPVVIDAIEFNPEFRHVDVLDELCFLWVECEMLGAAAGRFGERLVGKYLERSGDRPRPGVVEFYRSYRACVRAKVVLLRSRQRTLDASHSSPDQVDRYLTLADSALAQFADPCVVVVRGGSGSGKSSLSGRLAESLHAHLWQTDRVRQRSASVATRADAAAAPTLFDSAHYSRERRQAVYDELLRLADSSLAEGRSVVLDGTFPMAAQRIAAGQIAARHRARFLEITCQCPESVACERIAERLQMGADASEFRPEWLATQRLEVEPCEPTWATCAVDTNRDGDAVWRDAFGAVRALWDQGPMP